MGGCVETKPHKAHPDCPGIARAASGGRPGFTCLYCQVYHGMSDEGKSFNDGSLCKCCAHGIDNREARRQNPGQVCKGVRCWQVVADRDGVTDSKPKYG